MRDERSSFAIFRLLATPGIGPATARAVLDYAERCQAHVADLMEDLTGLAAVLSGKQSRDLKANHTKAAETWKKMLDKRIIPLAPMDPRYPESVLSILGPQAPLLLFVQGNLKLLSKHSLGFCGSRAASEKGIAVARECAEIVSKAGINVVSGYAAGVDMTTHRAALETGGTTTFVIAEGILHFRVKRDLKELWDWERCVVVSQYLPSSTWNVGNAMKRNQTICALCRAMVLIEAREAGGSIEAGRTCLKLGIPLFAPVYEGMPPCAKGNQMLLREGARSLYKNKSTNLPNLSRVLAVMQSPALQAIPEYR